METFRNDVSKLAWQAFSETGELGFLMLYNAIQHPENVRYRVEDAIISTSEELER